MFLFAAPLAALLLLPSQAAPTPFELSLTAGAAAIRANFEGMRQLSVSERAEALALLIHNKIFRKTPVAACLRDPACRGPLAVAHRTGGFNAPENSVGGVLAAQQASIALIETDIRLAKDGTWIMLHDDTLDRTTTMKGPVAARSWDELKSARLSNGETLPRFEDIYAASRGRSVLVLDLKVNAAEPVADWISRNGSFDDLIFFASDAATLSSCARAKAKYPDMLVMVRVEDGLGWKEAQAAYGGLPLIVHPDFPEPGVGDSLHARGSKLYASLTGHDRVPGWRQDAALLLVKRGADLIDTDNPSWLRSVLDGNLEPAVEFFSSKMH